MKWRLIESGPEAHQLELLGYDPDVGMYNMHWRDDIKAWCYTWNQTRCNPTHWMPLPNPPSNTEEEL